MELLANSIAVATSEIITLPICTIKTNFQTNNNYSIKYIINDIYRNYGFRGFFEAKFSALASQTISTTSKFYIYNLIKNYRKTDSCDIFNNSLNGMFSGILGSLISHPFDVLKVQQQCKIDTKTILQNISNKHIHYLYSGYSQSLLKNILLYSSMYPTYDFYKTKFDNPLISAPLTTITITSFIQPIDYIKTNYMVGNNKIDFTIKNLYKGLTLNLARSIPHFLISMSLTEIILNNIR